MNKTFGAIFDMDGVLIDSGAAHFEAFMEMGRRLNKPFTEELFRTCFGWHNNKIFPHWLGNLSEVEIEKLAEEKETIYRSIAPRLVKPIDGVLSLVEKLKSANWKIAIGSSGPKKNVDLAISILGISNILDGVVTGDDVKEGKPHPEIFLLAAKKMGLPSSSCLVLEDALAGIEAAKRAKMKCVAITTSLPKEKIIGASRVIDHFSELQITELESMLTSPQSLLQ